MLAQKSTSSKIYFADFLPYAPSHNALASFAVKAVTDKGNRLGYIAYQQPLEKINNILGERTGLGKTGQSYLVGQDYLMRSDPYIDPDNYSVKTSFSANNKVITTASNSALKGENDTAVIFDYKNNPVVSSWDFIDLGSGVRWALISEINIVEAFNPNIVNNEELYKGFIEKHDYYDLFLVSSQGYIFYTVTKEADLNTNILTGKYMDSNLGQLINKISQTKQYGFADFAPYTPSGGQPAAFFAQPLMDTNGQVVLYIALQLSVDGIQDIMNVRDGMGVTGESYLVGMDFKMRSNTYLDRTWFKCQFCRSGS